MALQKAKLKDLRKAFIETARKKGLDQNYVFASTLQRYEELLAHLVALERALKSDGALVTKEYVKDRKNLYVHPAIAAYNQTAASADRAAQLLISIVGGLETEGEGDDFDNF